MLPRSIEAEQAVIGGLILDASRWKDIQAHIQVKDFCNKTHQIIFHVLEDLLRGRSVIDTLILCEELKKTNKLEDAGGETYLFELANSALSAANILHHAKIIKEKSLQRDAIIACRQLQEEITSKKLSPKDIEHKLKTVLHEIQSGQVVGYEEGQWAVPLNPVSPPQIPSDIFPGWLGNMIEEISGSTETPKELPAMNGLAVLAACCQKKFIIEPEEGYQEPLNVWTLVTLEPANRKSSVMKHMSEPLHSWEKEQAEKLKPEIQRAISDRKTIEEKIKVMRKEAGVTKDPLELENLKRLIAMEEANLPEIKSIPRIWAQDITPENLGVKMAENAERLAIFSAEGGIFEIMAGLYSKKGNANIDIFLQAHAGDSIRVDRGSREPVFMSAPALTMGLAPQPSVLQSLSKTKEFRGKGLLARFLFAIPKSNLGYRKLCGSSISLNIKNQYSESIFALLNIEANSENCAPYVLKFDAAAYAEWKEFSKYVEVELRDGGKFEHIRDWAGKLAGAAARIAGLFHCALYARDNPAAYRINKDTTVRAITLAAILSEHALVAFNLIGADSNIEKAKKVLSWIKRKQITKFTARDCFNDLRGSFGKMVELQQSLDILVERFYIYLETITHSEKMAGRPRSQIYYVNEKINWEQI